MGDETMKITFTLNDRPVTADVAPSTLVSDLLRDTLDLTGTHVGCDTSQCGACVVHVDGVSVKSCSMLAMQADGCHVETIESLAQGDILHPMQEAFREHHGLQCGFCTPGMVMTAVAMAKEKPILTETDVRHGLEGNLCRCTGYQNIVEAIVAGAREMNRAR